MPSTSAAISKGRTVAIGRSRANVLALRKLPASTKNPQTTKINNPKPRNQPRCKLARICRTHSTMSVTQRRTVGAFSNVQAYQIANGEKYCGISC